jgi:hypothetical protein
MARITQDAGALALIEKALIQESPTGRTDAGEVAFVAKDLEFVIVRTYDREYPEHKAKRLVPIDTSVDPGAEEYSYGAWDMTGKAKFITDYAKDFPMVEAFLKRFVFQTAGIGVGYQYSFQDLRKAAMRRLSAGKSLDQARSDAASFAHDQFLDAVICFGDTKRNLAGFINHPDIPLATIPNGSWDTLTTGSDAENGKITADLTNLALTPEISTIQRHVADTLLLPLSFKKRLMLPTSTYVRQPLLLNWLANQESIKTVEFWNRLDAAYSTNYEGTLTYTANEAWAMAYQKSPEVLYFVIPLPFTQHPPQQEGLSFKVPCESRVGGMCVPRPIACCKVNVHS